MREGRGVHAGGHQACEMGHVDMEIGADLVGDLSETFEIDDARIGGAAGDDHGGLVFPGERFDLVEVDLMRVRTDAVLDGVEPFARKVRSGAMGEVAAGIQAHAENGVAGLGQTEQHRLVRLGARAGLNVCVITTEEGDCPIDRELLGDIDILAAAVIATSRIAFCIFVGEHASHRLQHRLAHDVLGGDQLDFVPLPAEFLLDCAVQFRVGLGEWRLEEGAGRHEGRSLKVAGAREVARPSSSPVLPSGPWIIKRRGSAPAPSCHQLGFLSRRMAPYPHIMSPFACCLAMAAAFAGDGRTPALSLVCGIIVWNVLF